MELAELHARLVEDGCTPEEAHFIIRAAQMR